MARTMILTEINWIMNRTMTTEMIWTMVWMTEITLIIDYFFIFILKYKILVNCVNIFIPLSSVKRDSVKRR